MLTTMVGVAVGLGNVWRFPYMVGKFGGAAFVLVYVLAVLLLGVPALVAEWSLGRATGRGTVGAYARGDLPGGRFVGWFLFAVVVAATAYYSLAIGWVLYAASGQLARGLGFAWSEGAILPPASGFDGAATGRQIVATGLVLLLCSTVLVRGLRRGTEAASRIVMPILFASLLVLIARALTLPGADAGVAWYLGKFELSAFSPPVVLAALGQAFFSLSLGGTFMVVYGSYQAKGEGSFGDALWTAGGDLAAGLLAGLAILPAVFALGLEPGTGPGLLFFTLPQVFAALPVGWAFGLIFFLALAGAALLSNIAALEVLVTGLTDNTSLSRRRALALVLAGVWALALPPMINLKIFVPWDLTFGSGMQVVGSFAAVLTTAWFLKRGRDLEALGGKWLVFWLRFVVPAGLLLVGGWWLGSEVLSG
jgi:NSS family neurotransmitter:Na+ symporter